MLFAWLFYRVFVGSKKERKETKEYNERLKKSLEDDRIYDPETGTFITLEEAQSGLPLDDKSISNLIPEEEIDDVLWGEQAIHARINNALIEANAEPIGLDKEQIEILNRSHILNHSKEWSYSKMYQTAASSFILLINITYLRNPDSSHYEKQILGFTKINQSLGHHVAEPATLENKLVNLVEDDTIIIPNWEVTTYKASDNINLADEIIRGFNTEKRSDDTVLDESEFAPMSIEIIENYVIYRCTRQIRLEDINSFFVVESRLKTYT
ncbi:MAG: hypothetical protein MI810_05605 [Flavobacteriales bacterium]|nr:hypothetical protein [Flavobacteriales bacterium]